MSRLLKQLLVLVLVACGNSPFLCAGSNPDDSGYTIGTILDSPPYSFLDEDGQPAGYDVDLTRAMARSMGLEVEIVIGPWEELRRDLENGSIDAIAGMYYSEQRDRQVDFSTPYIISHHTFFYSGGRPSNKGGTGRIGQGSNCAERRNHARIHP